MIRGLRQKTKTAKARDVRTGGLRVLQSLEDSYTAMRRRKENANPQGISNCLSQYLEEIILTISIAELLAKVFNQEEIIMISGKSQLNSKPFQLVYLRFAAQVT